jgi:hypothetical protein
MIAAGDLDQRITIERTQVGGGRTQIATVWASRLDVSDGERFGIGTGWTMTSRFVIRYGGAAAQVRPSDFVVHEGHSQQIKAVKRTKEGRHRFLEITATG